MSAAYHQKWVCEKLSQPGLVLAGWLRSQLPVGDLLLTGDCPETLIFFYPLIYGAITRDQYHGDNNTLSCSCAEAGKSFNSNLRPSISIVMYPASMYSNYSGVDFIFQHGAFLQQAPIETTRNNWEWKIVNQTRLPARCLLLLYLKQCTKNVRKMLHDYFLGRTLGGFIDTNEWHALGSITKPCSQQ